MAEGHTEPRASSSAWQQQTCQDSLCTSRYRSMHEHCSSMHAANNAATRPSSFILGAATGHNAGKDCVCPQFELSSDGPIVPVHFLPPAPRAPCLLTAILRTNISVYDAQQSAVTLPHFPTAWPSWATCQVQLGTAVLRPGPHLRTWPCITNKGTHRDSE